MKRTIVAVLLCMLVKSGVALAQCDDPYDAVLCAYTLTPAEEGAFSATDGTVSAFWSDAQWSGRDQVELVPPGNCMPGSCGFTDASDGSITVRMAASGRGLYVYAAVQDNIWVDPASAADFGADGVDLYFAEEDATTSFTCTDCLIGLYDSELTYTTQQFQVWMGGTSLPQNFRYARYDAGLWSWTTTNPTWAEAKSAYGFDAEVVQVDGTHKVQEWFLPWERYGDGIAVGADLNNRRLGFSGGYNDKDGDNANPDCLRWLGKDPWVGKGVTNYWGDLLLPADIGTVQPGVAVDPRNLSSRAAPMRRAMAGEYYTLTGRQVSSGALGAGTAMGLVVRRDVRTGGTSRAVTDRRAQP